MPTMAGTTAEIGSHTDHNGPTTLFMLTMHIICAVLSFTLSTYWLHVYMWHPGRGLPVRYPPALFPTPPTSSLCRMLYASDTDQNSNG
eukprot:scaffold12564_cov60-Attheya_sp.AAC.11